MESEEKVIKWFQMIVVPYVLSGMAVNVSAVFSQVNQKFLVAGNNLF